MIPVNTKCPNCAAQLGKPDAQGLVKCEFCGTELRSAAPAVVATSGAAPAQAKAAITEQDVLDLALQRLPKDDSLYFRPSIPAEKEKAAREEHEERLPAGEPVLALYDSTVFGGGDDGFMLTPHSLCWKNLGEDARLLHWEQIDPGQVKVGEEDGEKFLGVMGYHLELGDEDALLSALGGLVRELAGRARG